MKWFFQSTKPEEVEVDINQEEEAGENVVKFGDENETFASVSQSVIDLLKQQYGKKCGLE